MSKPKKYKPLQFILLILLVLLMILSFSMSFIPVGRAQEPESGVIATSDGLLCAEDQVIVKFKPTVPDKTVEHMLNAMSSETLDTSNDITIADVPPGESVESFMKTLADQPNVEYAQPNYLYTFETVSVNDTYVGNQWYLDVMNVFDAWDTTMGSSSVKVAVIDTGVDLNHPDLTGRFIAPTDVVDNDGNAQDDDGHGTHVAGIIGAVANNTRGVAGIAPSVKLMPIDVFGYYDTGAGKTVFGALTSEVIEGIDYAVANGADIINISLGGADYDNAFKEAIDDAVNVGIVVVAAAGNKGENGIHYPSDYDSCISVIATDWNDEKAGYSNYGAGKDISAPGGDDNSLPDSYDSYILSTSYDPATHTSGYAWMNGTSMASPMVSGVVALMLSVNPGLTVDQVKDILNDTAVDLAAPGWDEATGAGRVNAAAAVSAAAGIPYTPVSVAGITLSDTALDLTAGETYQLHAKVSPLGASDKSVTYSSSNQSTVTVDSSGLMTAVGRGTAVITAKTSAGNFASSCSVSVIPLTVSVTGVSILGLSQEAHATHFTGESFDITPVISPQNATNKAVKFESSVPSVATVDSAGHVNVNGVGTALISVTTVDRNLSSSIYLDAIRRGDADGDGIINILDYSLIRFHILGLKSVSNGLIPAADVDGNGIIDVIDYTNVRLHILQLKTIE